MLETPNLVHTLKGSIQPYISTLGHVSLRHRSDHLKPHYCNLSPVDILINSVKLRNQSVKLRNQSVKNNMKRSAVHLKSQSDVVVKKESVAEDNYEEKLARKKYKADETPVLTNVFVAGIMKKVILSNNNQGRT